MFTLRRPCSAYSLAQLILTREERGQPSCIPININININQCLVMQPLIPKLTLFYSITAIKKHQMGLHLCTAKVLLLPGAAINYAPKYHPG